MATFLFISCNFSKPQKHTERADSTPIIQDENRNPMQDPDLNLTGYTRGFEQKVMEIFTASGSGISVITGNKGLKLTINPWMLEKEDGSAVDGKIAVSMIELTNSEDLFRCNAATLSNGRLLASGGSYFVSLECNGQKLRLKNGRSLKVEFPHLKNREMELFYGNRDTSGNMNWVSADQPLIFNLEGNYTAYNPPFPDTALKTPFKSKYQLYDSLNNSVIFAGKATTLDKMVESLQKKGIDKNIDTVYLNPADYGLNNYRFDGFRFRNMFWKKYRVMPCKEIEMVKEARAKEIEFNHKRDSANKKYNEEWNKMAEENTFTNQLQKYYEPAAITKLGWINCDRFYNDPQNSSVPLDLPITYNGSRIEYFLMYKSINGLTGGILKKDNNDQYILKNLPQGQEVTFMAFIKNEGRIMQCREDFVIKNSTSIKLNFKSITMEEMAKIFGKNVKT
jgi:hypothetical protein